MERRGDIAPVVLVGVPHDRSSSFLAGAAGGPEAVRRELRCPSGNLSTEAGLDLAEDDRWADGGDLEPVDSAEEIERAASDVGRRGSRLLALGGDHSISWPLVRELARREGPPTVVQFDAHPDLYDELDGSRTSHACPFARILEDGAASRLVQVGIRASTPHQREQARRFAVETIGAGQPAESRLRTLEGPLYVSIDLDVLDPAFAPGVSHREPGGLSTRELLTLVAALPPRIVGADLVELNPARDVDGLTARVAAKLVKELLGRMIESCP